jgi:hypothetical protein
MKALEDLLQDDLHRLVDRVAATTRDGLMACCDERRPDLLLQLAGSEDRVTAARHGVLQAYAAWRDALDECADLWALAALAVAPGAEDDRRAA